MTCKIVNCCNLKGATIRMVICAAGLSLPLIIQTGQNRLSFIRLRRIIPPQKANPVKAGDAKPWVYSCLPATTIARLPDPSSNFPRRLAPPGAFSFIYRRCPSIYPLMTTLAPPPLVRSLVRRPIRAIRSRATVRWSPSVATFLFRSALERPFPGRHPLSAPLFALLLTLLLFAALNTIARQSIPADLNTQAEALSSAGLPDQAEPVFEELLLQRPADIELHYTYIRNHFQISPARRDEAKTNALRLRYAALAEDTHTAALGRFGLGLLAFEEGDHQAALDHLLQVPDPNHKYLHFLLGEVHLALGNKPRAEEHFRQEIERGGSLEQAVPALATFYLDSRRLDRLSALLSDPQASPLIGLGVKRMHALLTGDLRPYLGYIFIEPYRHLTLPAALTGLFIGLVWLLFLVRLDRFSPKPLWLLAGVFALSVLLTMSSLILSDLARIWMPLDPDSGNLSSLLYFILHVGWVEETVKLLPLALVACLGRVRRRSDFIIIGSVSALGFATLENALYFNYAGLDIASVRAVYSTVMHVCMTCLAAFLMAVAWPRRPAFGMSVGLAAAAIVHGAYDYFLSVESYLGSVFSLVSVLLLAYLYYRLIRGSLSASPFLADQPPVRLVINNISLFGASAVILFAITYVYTVVAFSTEIANARLVSLILGSLPGVIGTVGILGKITLNPVQPGPSLSS